jgi:hypothetical protein
VSLTRNGGVANTVVNVGSWKFQVAEQKAAALFEQPEIVDCSVIKRVAPDDLPDLGDAASRYQLPVDSYNWSWANRQRGAQA